MADSATPGPSSNWSCGTEQARPRVADAGPLLSSTRDLLLRLRARRHELHRHRVQAIAPARRPRAVVEHVAEVAVAAAAADLGADHAVALVDQLRDVIGIERLSEARPAGARLELRIGLEKRQAAQTAG